MLLVSHTVRISAHTHHQLAIPAIPVGCSTFFSISLIRHSFVWHVCPWFPSLMICTMLRCCSCANAVITLNLQWCGKSYFEVVLLALLMLYYAWGLTYHMTFSTARSPWLQILWFFTTNVEISDTQLTLTGRVLIWMLVKTTDSKCSDLEAYEAHPDGKYNELSTLWGHLTV